MESREAAAGADFADPRGLKVRGTVEADEALGGFDDLPGCALLAGLLERADECGLVEDIARPAEPEPRHHVLDPAEVCAEHGAMGRRRADDDARAGILAWIRRAAEVHRDEGVHQFCRGDEAIDADDAAFADERGVFRAKQAANGLVVRADQQQPPVPREAGRGEGVDEQVAPFALVDHPDASQELARLVEAEALAGDGAVELIRSFDRVGHEAPHSGHVGAGLAGETLDNPRIKVVGAMKREPLGGLKVQGSLDARRSGSSFVGKARGEEQGLDRDALGRKAAAGQSSEKSAHDELIGVRNQNVIGLGAKSRGVDSCRTFHGRGAACAGLGTHPGIDLDTRADRGDECGKLGTLEGFLRECEGDLGAGFECGGGDTRNVGEGMAAELGLVDDDSQRGLRGSGRGSCSIGKGRYALIA